MSEENFSPETEENYRETFGDFLRRHREASGKTLEAVCRTTRIPRRYIQAFEENNSRNFPDEAFTRGFLRSYSLEIGLDVDDALDRYDRFKRSLMPTQVREVKKPEQEFFLGVETESPQRESFAVWGIVIGLIVVIVIVASLVWMQNTPSSSTETESTSENGDVIYSPSTAAPQVPENTGAPLSVPVPSSILSIKALKDASLNLRLDDNPASDLQMKSGEIKVYSVSREVEIKARDRSAFEFQFNGKPLEVQGPVMKLFNRNLFNKD